MLKNPECGAPGERVCRHRRWRRTSGRAPTTCRPTRSPCDGGAGTVAAKHYDGGQPTNAPDLAGKPITVVDVPKLIGIGYFAATTKGQAEAAAELGNVTVSTDGPTEANIDEQITFIDNYITQGVNGILFAANDPVAIAPVLKKALAAGIHVVGYDANSQPDAREWFVNQAEFNGIGKSMIDSMAAEIGEDGAFAIVTSTFTTPNQARWIAEMQAYQAACHPNMKWLETVEAQEDNTLSFNQATTLINKYGDELKGLFGMTSVATPASADAVTQAGLCGKVAVVGLATPNAMKPYVDVRLREVGGAVEPGRPRLRGGPRAARRGRRQAEGRVTRKSRPAGSASCRSSTAPRSCSARRSSSPRRTSTTSTSRISHRLPPPLGEGILREGKDEALGSVLPPLGHPSQGGEGLARRCEKVRLQDAAQPGHGGRIQAPP